MPDQPNDGPGAAEPQPSSATENPQPVPQIQMIAPPAPPGNGMGVAGGVLGIVGFVLIWVPFLGGVLCLLALIFGIIAALKGRKEGLPIGMAVTGIVLGGIGTLIYAFVIMLLILGAMSDVPGGF